ncbi:MAG: transglycosylase domain-containing protein [Bacteroidia bacterium]
MFPNKFPKKPPKARNRVEEFLFKADDWRKAFKEKRPWPYRISIGSIIAILLLILFYFGFYLSVLWGAWGRMPSTKELQRINRPIASEVYSVDSVLLGRYFLENRTEIQFDDLDKGLIDALVSTEDARFFSHNGVDRRSQVRVLFKTLLLGDRSAGGGSTITQQLVKNLFPRQRHGFMTMLVNKQQESIIARRLEKVYSKEDILSHYLNTVSFGEQAYGVATAARRFFNKTPSTLNLEESATLVGMLKATSYYNPRRNPERARQRRNVVLDQMILYSGLATTTADSIKELPMALDYRREKPSEGPAAHFRAHLQEELKKQLDQLRGNMGQRYNLFSSGLRIYTSVDSRMQRYAEEAVKDHLQNLQKTFFRHWGRRAPWSKDYSIIERAVKRSDRYRAMKRRKVADSTIQKIFAKPVPMRIFTFAGEQDTLMSPIDSVIHYAWFLNAGFMVMDPSNGAIKAWVGGLDHRYFKYDHVTAKRQVGSTFKPVVYATALENGRDPCEYISNEQVMYPEYDNWEPSNSNGEYEGEYSMQGGLTNSVNTISVALIMETGANKVVQLAKNLGVKSFIPREPAIALGAADLSVLDMTTLYAGFANGGRPVKPFYIRRIEDANGKIIIQNKPSEPGDRVLSKRSAAMIHAMMRSVVDSGTAQRLRTRYGIYGNVAGKTGTSQNQTDGWFMGYTPKLVAGAWVGGEEQKVRFRSLRLGQGAAMALPVWAKFMQKIYKDPAFKDHKRAKFKPVSPDVQAALDCPPYQDTLSMGDGFWDWVWEEVARERMRREEDSLYEVRKIQRELERQQRQYDRQRRRDERKLRREEERRRNQEYMDKMKKKLNRRDTL